jgi:hypothetical protein
MRILGESLLQAHGNVRETMTPDLVRTVCDIDQKNHTTTGCSANGLRMIAGHGLLLMELRERSSLEGRYEADFYGPFVRMLPLRGNKSRRVANQASHPSDCG